MKRETLIEDFRVSKELINYYLKRGRCIILLDALDEVDKERRQELHSHVIHYFKNQNPNLRGCPEAGSFVFPPGDCCFCFAASGSSGFHPVHCFFPTASHHPFFQNPAYKARSVSPFRS